jgi:glycosyltransferase involved in cell wall biosynthesis
LEAYSKIESDDNFFIYVAPCEMAVEDAKRLGIKNILFLEPTIDIERLSKIYNTFDLHCHSNNIGETFGNTLAESMVHGIPSISHIGFNRNWPQAQKELLKDFDELCINLNDYNTMVDEYSRMMNKFSSDKEYYNKIKLFYYNESKKYLYNNIALEYLNVYKKILNKTGWLVNDCLTCIPGTKTFWHDLLENVDGLVDKCDGHTPYSILPTRIENELQVEPPNYIIRNATFFRKMNTSVPTISLLQDVVVDRNVQIDTCNSSTVTVFNSQYTKSLYPEVKNSVVIPLGTDFDKFKPLDNVEELKDKYGIKDNTVLYVGSSTVYPKGFDMMESIIENTGYEFVLIMKDGYQSSNPRVKVFNRISQDEIVEISNCCSMLLCTSKEETLHLGGVEAAACNLPIITTNVGIYPNVQGDGWGHICDSLETFLQTIEIVFSNLDSYEPREIFLKNGLDKVTSMKKWNMLIDKLNKDGFNA